MNLVIALVQTHIFVRAIAWLELNWKKMRQMGITMPPPPMPAALETARTRRRTIDPTYSFRSRGHTAL